MARYTVSRRQFDNPVAMNDIETVRHHDQSCARRARQLADHALELAGISHRECERSYAERGRSSLEWGLIIAADVGGGVRIEENCGSRDAGRHFAQHLQPFAGHRRLEAGEARDVGPWMRDVGDEPAAFGIRDLNEDDRNRIGHSLQGQSARCGMRDDHIGGERHQLLGEGGDAIRTSRRPAVVDAQIASIDPSQGLQAVVQPGDHQLRLLIAFADAR